MMAAGKPSDGVDGSSRAASCTGPEWIEGLVVQNGNAYEAGLSPILREFVSLRPGDEGAEAAFRDLYTLPAKIGRAHV